ncbi:chitinase [Bacillus sp. SA1-12]|uniref:glycoside hydrolase family 18 protein n=1 Tax=Bacillus sp. SA1-12 TaxID=1455638 RepID=UPI000626900F|nr:glycoside hydrolase family 18 protein [Bacillus sp. SA1-12]KKI91972.1 chitinase [Bacillus sp. SA1-12]
MKKRFLLLTITFIFIFIGGFFSGIFYSNSNIEQRNIQLAPKSGKQPKQKPAPKIEQTQPNVLIGYVQDFRDPATIDYSKLSHIIFSFAHPAKDGSVLMNGESALSNLRAMVQKAHKQDTKVMLAVGGWYHLHGGESYNYFKTAIANSSSRTKLINGLMEIVERENLDGIDIDFEHPRTEEDAKHLTAFTRSLSSILHSKNKELSIAVYSKIHSVSGEVVTSVIYEPTMFKHVDHVNIMAYDGQWDGEYNAANLSPYPFTENIVNYWATLFEKHGISKEKLVLGVPVYAQPENLSINQASYAAIINNDPKNAMRDRVEMNGTIYHYNGVATIQKKTKLALDNGFGGMMIWELGQDAHGEDSLTSVMAKMIEEKHLEENQFFLSKHIERQKLLGNRQFFVYLV